MAATEKDESQIAIARTLKNIPWCEEYERMISGMLYNSLVPELDAGHLRARQWCHKYNTTMPTDPDLTYKKLAAIRYGWLTEILGAVGPDAFIEPPFTVDYGCNLRLGNQFYANFNFCVLDCGLVTIGDRVMIGPNVSIFAATHEVEVDSRRDNIEYAKPVVIGDDCWIGGHTVILPGVTIGNGVTVAAGSIVTKDVPSWVVVMGQPAKVVKKVPESPYVPKEASKESEFSAMERGG